MPEIKRRIDNIKYFVFYIIKNKEKIKKKGKFMINQDIVNLAKKLQKNAENTGNRFFAIEILDEFIEDYK